MVMKIITLLDLNNFSDYNLETHLEYPNFRTPIRFILLGKIWSPINDLVNQLSDTKLLLK